MTVLSFSKIILTNFDHLQSCVKQVLTRLGHLLDLSADHASEEEVIAWIRKGLSLRGMNLWILIFALPIC